MIVAEAYRDAQKVKGDGDAKASAIFAESFGRDPQFAQFYRSLEAYRASFRSKSDLMIVDPSSEFFKAMRGSGHAGRRRRRAPAKKVALGAAAFWDVALSAVALMLIAEGLLPFVSPLSWRRIFERALQMSDGQIRFLGLVSVLCGLAMLLLFWS